MAQKVPHTPALMSITPPPTPAAVPKFLRSFIQALFDVLMKHAMRLNAMLASDGTEAMTGPLPLAVYTVLSLPLAVSFAGAVVYVSNESGGAQPAWSDGVNWRRFEDGAIVS